MDEIGGLIGNGLQGCACQLSAPSTARKPHNCPSRSRIPVRRAQASKCGNKIHTPRIVNRLGQGLGLSGSINNLQTIAQPLNRCARAEHRAFKRVGYTSRRSTRKRRQQTMRGRHRPITRLKKCKTPRAIRIFNITFENAPLPKKRGLLIARNPPNGNARRQDAQIRSSPKFPS